MSEKGAGAPLLTCAHLSKTFPAERKKRLHAVSDVSLSLEEGETLGLVGESGCGKSTLARLLVRLLKPDAGEIRFRGQEITSLPEKDFRALRRQLQMVFQDPYASLDPRMSVREVIAEPLVTHRLSGGKKQTTERVLQLMDDVGLPGEFIGRYPHQFSGGQRQRIGIARALAAEPALIVCDEPVSALDVSVQNQILNLLRALQKDRHLTYLFISHDLSVVRYMADRICVMFLGKICEIGPVELVYTDPRHPYTRFLLDAVPVPDPHQREEAPLLKGEPPSPVDPPSGCRFRTRCPRADAACAAKEPPLREADGRLAACFHPLEPTKPEKNEEKDR